MKKVICALLICIAQPANADSQYHFSSDRYSSINNSTTCRAPADCQNFTGEISASGYFSLKESPSANLNNKDIRDSLTTFTITDGIKEYSNSNSFISRFSVSTDSSGTITDTRIAIRKWQDKFSMTFGGYLDELWLNPNAQASNFLQCNNSNSNLCNGANIVESTSYVYPGTGVKRIADPPPIKSPPFGGTIFINPEIIRANDKSTKTGLSYKGTASRLMYDRRHGWIRVSPFLFDAYYDNGSTIEFQVNPEFGSKEEGEIQANFYSHIIGQLPNVLRKDIETVSIHKGNKPFGGGDNNILIHTGMSEYYIRNGILEETLAHEACHTSMDQHHANSIAWLNSQALDDNYISDYARDYPLREDVAESFLPYLAIRYHAARIPPELESTIKQTMPHRISYFDNQGFDTYPIKHEEYRHALTVEKQGFGTVISNPEGIICGSACTSRYPNGASVYLQPDPASGYSFSGWSGACSGTGPCILTMNADKQVTATFTLNPINPYDRTKPFVQPKIPSNSAFVKQLFTIGWQLNLIQKNMPVRVKFTKDGR
jgi:Divergent InlB B-repeat domain